jgi:hypothetical protein
MANALYALAKQKFLSGALDLTSADIKLVLVDTADYTVNLTTHEFLSDVPSGARVATSSNFAGKSVTLGVFDATDVVLSAVTGDVSEALVIYKDTGVAGTSPLIAYIDTATGLPATPNGTDITISWSSGASKIFAL